MAIGDNLEIYTFDYLMNEALSQVPENLDKRQGSIIYDALAPACYVLAQAYMNLRNFYNDTYAVTATGSDLDNKAAEQGITRFSATYAVRKAYFADSQDNPMEIPFGSRFSTISDTNPIIYYVSDYYREEGNIVPGTYELTCEVAGTIGNQYSGNLVNISVIQGISTAVMSSLLVPARNEETDEELRTRYFDALNTTAFGGNIADYREKVTSIAGVGAVQIYPVWDGGGTVKLSIIDTEYNKCSSEFVNSVQTIIDPEINQGIGLGIAPIGHSVTVTTPTEIEINTTATVVPVSGYQLDQLQTPIEEAISSYLLELRKEWAQASNITDYSLSVYLARVTAAIVGVPGVANVTGVELNDDTVDIDLIEDSQIQQLPVLGTVTLHEFEL